MTDILPLYGNPTFENAPAWSEYPGEVNPAGLREMQRTGGHPCFGCPFSDDHVVPGRVTVPTAERGAAPPWDSKHSWPGVSFMRRVQEVTEYLAYIVLGNVTDDEFAGVHNSQYLVDGFNPLMANIFGSDLPQVVGASGKVLTLKSGTDPNNLLIERLVPKQPSGAHNNPIRSRIQPGDIVRFYGTPLADKCRPRVVSYSASNWGSSQNWTLTVDQDIGSAADPSTPGGSTPYIQIRRPAVYPFNWFEFYQSHLLYTTRINGWRLTFEQWNDLGNPDFVELLDTAGQSCRIAYPRAPSGNFAGTFRALFFDSGAGTLSDITATVIERLRISHIGSTGYQTEIEIGGSFSELLQNAGEALIVDYEAEAVDGDPFIRGTSQSICKHSIQHAALGWICGLASRSEIDEITSVITLTPPSGLAKYRSGSEAGCYQLRTCDSFEERIPTSLPLMLNNWLKLIYNGVKHVLNDTLNNESASRPAYPSGAPGLRTLAGRVMNGDAVTSKNLRLSPGGGITYCQESGSGSSRRLENGAENIYNSARGNVLVQHKPRAKELDVDTPLMGILKTRQHTEQTDGLGRAWSNTTDPDFGFRDAGPFIQGCSEADTGSVTGRGDAFYQTATTRRVFTPVIRVDSSMEDEEQNAGGDQAGGMSATLQADGTMILRVGKLFSGLSDPGEAAKVAGRVAAASTDSGLIKIELELGDWEGNFDANLGTPPVQETPYQFKGGGKFVFLPPSFLPFDYNDEDGKTEGGNPARGAMVGDSVRFYSTGINALDRTGFIIDRALPCNGTQETWSASIPGPPATAPYLPKNYANWLNKRDVIWLHDRDDGVLASNLGSLVGSVIICNAFGALNPEVTPSLFHAVYQADWSAIDPGDIDLVDCFTGEITLAASFIAGLDSTLRHCFRADLSLLDRRAKPQAEHFNEILREQGLMDSFKVPIATGSIREFFASVDEDAFSEIYGQPQWSINAANDGTFPDSGTLLNSPTVEILGPPDGWCDGTPLIEDEALLTQGDPASTNLFESNVQTISGAQYTRLFKEVHLEATSAVVFPLGPLSRFPGDDSNIVSASASLRIDGSVRTTTAFTMTGNGSSITPSSVVTVTSGSGSYKIALFGSKVINSEGDRAASPLGTTAAINVTDDDWTDIDLTDVVKQILRHRDSLFDVFYLLALPAEIGSIADTDDIGASLQSFLPDVTFSVYEPLYSSCSGGSPVANPSRFDRTATWTNSRLEWSSMEIIDLMVKVDYPSAMGQNMIIRNSGNLDNWPSVADFSEL